MNERLLELLLISQAKVRAQEKKKAEDAAKSLSKKRRDRLYELTQKDDEDSYDD